jgi:hypothetical protein
VTLTRQCPSGKRTFPDDKSAKAAMTRVRQRALAEGQVEPIPNRVYRCERCHRWHLTTEEYEPGRSLR